MRSCKRAEQAQVFNLRRVLLRCPGDFLKQNFWLEKVSKNAFGVAGCSVIRSIFRARSCFGTIFVKSWMVGTIFGRNFFESFFSGYQIATFVEPRETLANHFFTNLRNLANFGWPAKCPLPGHLSNRNPQTQSCTWPGSMPVLPDAWQRKHKDKNISSAGF